jgi:hypothetical protein
VIALTFLFLAQLHPQVSGVVEQVSEERIAASMRKLESFGTRDIHSTTNLDAQQWIAAEFKAASPKLEVTLDTHKVPKKGRVQRDLDVVNVVAKLPGKSRRRRKAACPPPITRPRRKRPKRPA